MEKIPKGQCLRCSGTMQAVGIQKIQLGQSGLLIGIWGNLIAGSFEVDIHICSDCGRVEFYSTRSYRSISDDDFPKKTCPECGIVYDPIFEKCPICQYKY